MRRTLKIALFIAVLFSIYAVDECRSQDDTQGRKLMTVDGKVGAVDISRSTITIKTANELTFSVPADTPIVSGIYDIKLSDIEPEDDVTIEHSGETPGKLIATKITLKNKEL